MKIAIKILGIYFLFAFVFHLQLFAQEDTSVKKPLKNTVRINLTNPIFFGDNYWVFGYERIVMPNQSFSINTGRFSIPKFVSINTGDLDIQKEYEDRGIHVSADYRFYLKSVNKYDAPRGVYVGPYYSYNYFNRENNWTYTSETFNGTITTDLTLNFHTIGAQLGYQFVLWRRLSIDMILLGPGIGIYKAKAKLGTTLTPEDESEFFQKLNELLGDKFPGYDQVIKSGEFETKGSFNITSLGYRYMIQIGFRF
ncbi:MAG: DUF3575 domain-containing protein [Bacteroidales bacterium]